MKDINSLKEARWNRWSVATANGNEESNGICLNRDSDYVTDSVDDDFVCEEWEEEQ